MKKIYNDYAELKTKEKEIKDQLAKINPLIVADMVQKSEKSLETPWGKFSISRRSIWAYSESIDNQKAKLVKAQEKEQATGVAKQTIKASLTFNTPKAEK